MILMLIIIIVQVKRKSTGIFLNTLAKIFSLFWMILSKALLVPMIIMFFDIFY